MHSILCRWEQRWPRMEFEVMQRGQLCASHQSKIAFHEALQPERSGGLMLSVNNTYASAIINTSKICVDDSFDQKYFDCLCAWYIKYSIHERTHRKGGKVNVLSKKRIWKSEATVYLKNWSVKRVNDINKRRCNLQLWIEYHRIGKVQPIHSLEE